jgi:hypothetical protein
MRRAVRSVVARFAALVTHLAALTGTPPSVAALTVACDPNALIAALSSLSSASPPTTLDLTPGCTYSFTTPADHFFGRTRCPPSRAA